MHKRDDHLALIPYERLGNYMASWVIVSSHRRRPVTAAGTYRQPSPEPVCHKQSECEFSGPVSSVTRFSSCSGLSFEWFCNSFAMSWILVAFSLFLKLPTYHQKTLKCNYVLLYRGVWWWKEFTLKMLLLAELQLFSLECVWPQPPSLPFCFLLTLSKQNQQVTPSCKANAKDML